MANVTLPVRLAPEVLDQPILPGWQFSLFSIDLGDSSDPEVEKAAIAKIGSYGKQIGHLAEALEIVINELGLMEKPMAQEKRDALQIFLGDVAAARGLKPKRLGGGLSKQERLGAAQTRQGPSPWTL